MSRRRAEEDEDKELVEGGGFGGGGWAGVFRISGCFGRIAGLGRVEPQEWERVRPHSHGLRPGQRHHVGGLARGWGGRP